MNYKWIMKMFVGAFFVIFVGSLLFSISSFNISRAQLDYRRDNIEQEDLLSVIDTSNTLNFVGQLLQIVGGLMLSLSSAIGAFIVEDKYATLGLLLFSALVTVFVLTTILLRLAYPTIYYY